MPKHKTARIISALAALMLSTACSTTETITITAPGDTTAPTDSTAAPGDTPAPTDSTAAPGDTTAPTDSTAAPGDTTAPTDGTTSPGDDTPTGSGTTSPGDTTAPTDGTTSPGDTTAPTDSTTTTDTSETSVTVGDQDSANGQESAEPAPFTYEYPEFWLINRNDRSTPLGKLCWAFFEYVSTVLVRTSQILADDTPNWEVTFPAVADITEGVNNGVGPVGVVNEDSNEPSIGTEGYLIDSLGEILEPSIAGIVDDPGLSEELQLFAEAFFAQLEAVEEQTRTVGWANIDRARLPYQDFDDMPYEKEFDEAFIANPDKCVFPSEDEIGQSYDSLEVKVNEYLEETGGPVIIE